MVDAGPHSRNAKLARMLRSLADQVFAVAADVSVLFVTNLREGEVRDIGPGGIDNSAQYYNRSQADRIVRSLQEVGVTVHPYMSELEFMRSVAQGEHRDDKPHTVVFTTAEGGTGSGRRALIPAFCNLVGLPFMNSGAHAASLACHKFHANAVLRSAGVRVPETWLMEPKGWLHGRAPSLGSRVIVKPTYEAMCIGVADDSVRVVDGEFTEFARAKANLFGQPAVVQEFISGEEVGVPLIRLGNTIALPPVAFRRADGAPFNDRAKTFLDENIVHDTSTIVFDADPLRIRAVQQAGVRAFEVLQMRGVGRIDVRIDADGRVWVFDSNIAPPPLIGSSYAISLHSLGLGFQQMLAVWLGAALLDANVLSGVQEEVELAEGD